MKHTIMIIVALVLLSSCRAKKPIVTKEIITKIDTVYVEKETVKKPPITTDWSHEDPCDSITGRLRDFERIVSNGSDKVIVRSVGGILHTEVRISGSMDTMLKEHRSSLENSDIVVEVPVEVNKPWKSKWFWISIAINILFILTIIKRFTKWIPGFPI